MNIKPLLLLVLSCLLSCSDFGGEGNADGGGKSSALKIGGRPAVDMGEKGFLLDGTASNGGNSGRHFRLGFHLPKGESLKFFFYASRELEGGVELVWMRSLEGEVIMEISLNGKRHRHILKQFVGNERFNVDLNIHNVHSDAHILVWKGDGPRGDWEGCTFDGGCLYNTQDFALDVWLRVGRASGVHWGFQGDADWIQSLEGPLIPESNV